MLTDNQLEMLSTNQISRELLGKTGLDESYYLSPLMYIEDILGLTLTCTGQEYRHAVEMAHDEDLCPEDANLPVIVDGILAFVFADELEEVGIDITTYFTYRFHPPSKEFQDRINHFERLIGVINDESELILTLQNDGKFHVVDSDNNSIGAAYEIPDAIKEARKVTNDKIDFEDDHAGNHRYIINEKPDDVFSDTDEFIAELARLGGMQVTKLYNDKMYFIGYTMELI